MTDLITYAPLQLSEQTLNITMKYLGQHGHRGYGTRTGGFIHQIFAKTAGNKNELNEESIPGGPVPTTVHYGLNIQVMNLDGYFPYRINDVYDVLLPAIAPYRVAGYNTVKNIFLVASVLTVIGNGNGLFAEMPINSKWYVKKYTWKRDVANPDRGAFNLVLWRWWKDG